MFARVRWGVLFSLAVLAQEGYVRPEVCAGCHGEIAASYAQTGMGRSFRRVRPGEVLAGFDGREFSHRGQKFRAVTRGGRLFLERAPDALDPRGAGKEVHYIFGSGNHARSFLSRTLAGRLVELPLTWYPESGGYWAMSPAFDRPDHPGFTREIGFECMFCHNGYPAMRAGEDWPRNSPVFPETLPEGIDCQRCHGPGAAHVSAAGSGSLARLRDSIVNPARLPADRQMEVCMQCHLETTSLALPGALTVPGRGVFSYRPGEPLANYALFFQPPDLREHFDFVSSVTRLRDSACFLRSAGKMTCTTCHDPHRIPRGQAAVAHYSRVCRSCHSQALSAAAHSTVSECVSCHMPKRRPEDVVHAMATDHWIRARPTAPPPPAEERHDGNTAPYRGEVKLYYPAALKANAEQQLTAAIAQVKQQANLGEGIRRLEAAIARWKPASGEAYFELGEAFRNAGNFARAEQAFTEACRRSPARWVHWYGYGLTLTAAGKFSRALEVLGKAEQLAPAEPTIVFASAEALMRLGRRDEAIAAYRRALARNPDMAEVWNNLGSALVAATQRDEAESAFRESVRIRPDLAPAQVNLANLLLGGSRVDEAIARYRLVTAAAKGRFPAVHLNLGLALAARGRVTEARAEWSVAASGEDAGVSRAAKELLSR
ncbi:MAG: tetratricopeptide repeat protein [Bryobacteraceae bacterium]